MHVYGLKPMADQLHLVRLDKHVVFVLFNWCLPVHFLLFLEFMYITVTTLIYEESCTVPLVPLARA